MMDRSVDYILLMLAISKIGGVYAPFDLKQPSARIEQVCKEAKVKFIVTQNNFISKIEGFYEYLLYPDNLDNNKSLLSNSVEMDASDPF